MRAGSQFLNAWQDPNVSRAVGILMQRGQGLGRGDLNVINPLVGRWAGDRVSMLGEYAQFDGYKVSDVQSRNSEWTDVSAEIERIVNAQEEYDRNLKKIAQFSKEHMGEQRGRVDVARAMDCFMLSAEHIDLYTNVMEDQEQNQRVVGLDDAAAAAIQVHGSWKQFTAEKKRATINTESRIVQRMCSANFKK